MPFDLLQQQVPSTLLRERRIALLTAALDAPEAKLLDERFGTGGNPVLEICARHAVMVRDAAGNRKLDKSKATSRIDGMVALAIALGVAQSEVKAAEPEHQIFFW